MLFIPYRRVAPLPPKEEAKIVFASVAKQTPGRAEVYGAYFPFFFRGIAAVALLPRNDGKAIVLWDISLPLNMTESPLSALRATSPEGGSEVCFTVFAKECSDCGNLPGG